MAPVVIYTKSPSRQRSRSYIYVYIYLYIGEQYFNKKKIASPSLLARTVHSEHAVIDTIWPPRFGSTKGVDSSRLSKVVLFCLSLFFMCKKRNEKREEEKRVTTTRIGGCGDSWLAAWYSPVSVDVVVGVVRICGAVAGAELDYFFVVAVVVFVTCRIAAVGILFFLLRLLFQSNASRCVSLANASLRDCARVPLLDVTLCVSCYAKGDDGREERRRRGGWEENKNRR